MHTRVFMVSFTLVILSLVACQPSIKVSEMPSETKAAPSLNTVSAPPSEIESTSPPETESAPTSETEPNPGLGEAGFYPLSTRTGNKDVDPVLAAVESGDPQKLRDLLRFLSIACTNADGLGGPPKCMDDETDGTMVEVFPFLGSEGNFLRKDNVENFQGVKVSGLYAVYKVKDTAYSDEAYPAGEYAAIFSSENGLGVVIQISDGIVRLDYLFPPTMPGDIVQSNASELILEPKQ